MPTSEGIKGVTFERTLMAMSGDPHPTEGAALLAGNYDLNEAASARREAGY
jgi:hypothetical protein